MLQCLVHRKNPLNVREEGGRTGRDLQREKNCAKVFRPGPIKTINLPHERSSIFYHRGLFQAGVWTLFTSAAAPSQAKLSFSPCLYLVIAWTNYKRTDWSRGANKLRCTEDTRAHLEKVWAQLSTFKRSFWFKWFCAKCEPKVPVSTILHHFDFLNLWLNHLKFWLFNINIVT